MGPLDNICRRWKKIEGNFREEQDMIFHVSKYGNTLRIEYSLNMPMLYALSKQSAESVKVFLTLLLFH